MTNSATDSRGFGWVAKIIDEDDLAYAVFVGRIVCIENSGHIDDGLCNTRNSELNWGSVVEPKH